MHLWTSQAGPCPAFWCLQWRRRKAEAISPGPAQGTTFSITTHDWFWRYPSTAHLSYYSPFPWDQKSSHKQSNCKKGLCILPSLPAGLEDALTTRSGNICQEGIKFLGSLFHTSKITVKKLVRSSVMFTENGWAVQVLGGLQDPAG